MTRDRKNAVEGLETFEGRDVLQSTIRITRAGDGLSDALAVEPTEFHLGDTVTVVLECTVTKVHYEELSDTGTLRRVHTLSAGTSTIVAPEFVREVLTAQREAIDKARGVQRLPLDEPPADDADDEAEGNVIDLPIGPHTDPDDFT